MISSAAGGEECVGGAAHITRQQKDYFTAKKRLAKVCFNNVRGVFCISHYSVANYLVEWRTRQQTVFAALKPSKSEDLSNPLLLGSGQELS
jgi:hypothetical protein